MFARISRREMVLGGAALIGVTVSGCSMSNSSLSPSRVPAAVNGSPAARNATIRAELALRDAAVVSEQHLLQRCQATARRHPALEIPLRPLARDHRAHLRVLAALSTSTVRQPTPAAPDVPPDRRGAVVELRRAERQAVEARVADCVEAGSGRLAQLLASVAASGAQHASLLAALR